MEQTPLKTGSLPTSTPIHSFADSGYFGSNNRSFLKKVVHTLSPIKEFSPLKKRFTGLVEFSKPCILETPVKGFHFTSDDLIKELDFNNFSDFTNSLDDSYENNSKVEKKSSRNFYHSFLLLDPVSENLLPVEQEQIDSVPARSNRDLNELFDQSRLISSDDDSKLSSISNGRTAYSAQTVYSFKSNKVDFVKELQKINCTLIVSAILSYLSEDDLCRACCVNKQWKGIVLCDSKANSRRKRSLEVKRDKKENKVKAAALDGVPRWTLRHTGEEHKTLLLNISNILVSSQQPLEIHYNTKFDSFLKERKNLTNGVLIKCPLCNYAAKNQDGVKYICTKCNYVFCQKCSSPYVKNHECSKPKVVGIIGSKQSKRNLKRL